MKVWRSILLGCLLLCTEVGYSQLINTIGAYSGIVVSNQEWKYHGIHYKKYNRGHRIGVNAGVYVESLHNKYLKLVNGIGYTQKGYQEKIQVRTTNTITDQTIRVNNRLDYLSFFSNAKLQYKLGKFTPYALGGYRLEFNVGYNAHPFYEPYFKQFEKFHLSFFWGGGLMFDVKEKQKIFLEVSGNADTWWAFREDDLAIKNLALEIKLGTTIGHYNKQRKTSVE